MAAVLALVVVTASACGGGGGGEGASESDSTVDESEGLARADGTDASPSPVDDGNGPNLVGDAEPGAVFTVSGLTIGYDEIADVGAEETVPVEYGALISPVLEDGLEGDLTRYRNQLQFLVNRVASRGQADRVHLLGAAYRELPSLDGGVSIVATVLVDNRGDEDITDVVIDAELLDRSGAAVADGRFVLGRSVYGDVPAQSMMLANLIFPPARVSDEEADLVDRPQLSTRVDWEVR